MARIIGLVLVALLSAAPAGAQLPGSGALQGRTTLAVPGCHKGSPDVSAFTLIAGDGRWSVVMGDGRTLGGTYTAAKRRRARLAFDDASTAALAADVASQASERCQIAVTITSARTKRFLVTWNRAHTRVKVAIVEIVYGQSAERRGHATFRLNAKGAWAASG